MHFLGLIAISVFITTTVRGQNLFVPCDSHQGDTSGDPAMPELPDQFETRIEANIVQKNYSTEMTEYYDYVNNRGAFVHHRHGYETRIFMQFHNLEQHIVYNNNTCTVGNMTNLRFNIFNFTTNSSGGHVKGVKDILIFGKQFGEVHIGEEKVRGITVDHWQSCLKFANHNGSFILDYYFSKPTFNMTYGFKPVPVRAVINGTGDGIRSNGSLHHFYHVYDFFSFRRGPIQDERVFQLPVGVFCNGSVNQKPIPNLPDQFTTGVEMTHANGAMTDKSTEQFYYPSQLLRSDNSRPMSGQDYLKYGNRPLSVIYDFNNSLVYTIDKWNGNCSVRSVDPTLDSADLDGHMRMRRAQSLFHFMDTNYTYQGKKTWRDIRVESWAAFNKSDGHFQEVLFIDPTAVTEFLPRNQGSQGNGRGPGQQTSHPPGSGPMGSGGLMVQPPPVAQVIVGLYDRIVNNAVNLTTIVNFFGFEPGHLDVNAFDVTQCYEAGHQYIYMAVKIQGSYALNVNGNERAFYAAARSAIARGAKVSSTRVTSLMIEDDDSEGYIKIYFRLLDKIKVKDVQVKGPTLTVAKNMLRNSIAVGLNFDVQYPTVEENFQMVQDYLGEVQSQSPVVFSPSTDSQKYGPGSMAGLAIGMLIVGAILGLLAAYVIYRKIDTSVPYQVSN